METALLIAGWTVFGLAIVAGLILDLVGLFGNWIILAAVTIAWMATGFEHFGWVALLILLGLAIVGEVLEAAASALGAKRFGGGKGAMVAALVGCLAGAVVGTPIFPIIGTLLGACGGAFAAATLYEYIHREKEVGEAMWTGLGAALGKIAGLFAKTFVGVLMLVVAAFMY